MLVNSGNTAQWCRERGGRGDHRRDRGRTTGGGAGPALGGHRYDCAGGSRPGQTGPPGRLDDLRADRWSSSHRTPMCYNVYTMNGSVGVRALRQRVSEVLERVKGGEVVTVTDRGRPVARIVPLRGGDLEQLVREGRATEAEGDLLAMVEELGLPEASPGGTSPSAALAELRADER